jgi:hypothetical protein
MVPASAAAPRRVRPVPYLWVLCILRGSAGPFILITGLWSIHDERVGACGAMTRYQ